MIAEFSSNFESLKLEMIPIQLLVIVAGIASIHCLQDDNPLYLKFLDVLLLAYFLWNQSNLNSYYQSVI